MAWDYLEEPVLQVRQRMAAHFLDGCENILEIGAYKTPITPYLHRAPKELVIADPLIEAGEWNDWNGKPSKIRHWKQGVEKLELDYFSGRPFGFLACGVDLAHPEGDAMGYLKVVCHFLCLISRAQIAVLEFQSSLPHQAKLFQVVLSLLQPRIAADIKLDLSRWETCADITEEIRQRFLRRMVVLTDCDPIEKPKSIMEAAARILFGSEAAAHLLKASDHLMTPLAGGLALGSTRKGNDGARLEIRGDVVQVTTAAQAWYYGAIIPLSQAALAAVRGDVPVPAKVEVEVSVDAGEVGVGMLADDFQNISGERMLKAGADRQIVQLFVPDARGHMGLLVRNGEKDNTISVARIHRVVLSLPEK